MNIKHYIKICFLMTILGLSSGCSNNVEMRVPNPASHYCTEQGGTLKIARRGDDAEYGICIFDEICQCEEWALFYDECPIGGRNVSRYTTPESTYCALQGAKVLEDENACLLFTGKKCSLKDFFNGKCI